MEPSSLAGGEADRDSAELLRPRVPFLRRAGLISLSNSLNCAPYLDTMTEWISIGSHGGSVTG
jgi:hypothetical protein